MTTGHPVLDRITYLVIGAQKSGTSSLCDVLARHPQVFMTRPKEPYFFSHPEVWAKGFDWYATLFEGSEGARAVGEGSTTYTQQHLYPDAPARIAEHLPHVRFLFIARDPLERMVSHWMHLRSRGGREHLPFAEALRANPVYVDHSRYDHQLELYRDHFPDDRFLAVLFEDYKRDPEPVLRRCFEHLGVDPDVPLAPRREAQHRSDTGRVDTGATRLLRRIPGFTRLRDLAPSGLRGAARAALKKPIESRPSFDDAARRWAIEQVRSDSAAFLARHGLRTDAWSFDPETGEPRDRAAVAGGGTD